MDGQSSSQAGPSTAPETSSTRTPLGISGCEVGVLDPSQRDRLLSTPDAKLSFATFHPRTAAAFQSGQPHKLSTQDELCNSKRIVIETVPGGESFWRWVPRARGVQSVEEEGHFPRVIEICGELVHCTQEQWDIYKLDPAYDCLIQPPPKLTVISRKGKKRASEAPSEGATRKAGAGLPDEEPSKKKARHVHVETVPESDSDDEDEVIEMIIDESQKPRIPSRLKELHQERARQRHRQRVSSGRTRPAAPPMGDQEIQELSMIDLTLEDESPPAASPQAADAFTFKRTYDEQSGRPSKRVRTRPPSQEKHGPRHPPQKAREKLEERIKISRMQREQAFVQSLFAAAAEANQTGTNGAYTTYDTRYTNGSPDLVSLEEKIRRVAEINEYEQARAAERARKEREAQEAAERRRRAEELRARLEQERIEQERRWAREQERRRRQKEQERWLYGPWTSQRALERYRMLSDVFDVAKFSPEKPIGFLDIPWPVLARPTTYGPQDIDWTAVEHFFKTVRTHMRSQDYKLFVEKSHKRFHPDRWKARRVLQSVEDEEERSLMEVAANTVAQAITPLWREVKG
ncbi:unnamed protein product [Somion occarium]|uniref:Uncharacterized protein n=1 Tax=Somion occarium TaxID=3059160 RepID=A0ABP1DKK4_9APHY